MLSAPGSVLLYDVVGKALLEAPILQNTIEFMQELGAPWVFGSYFVEATKARGLIDAAPTVAVATASAGPAGAGTNFLVARLYRFVELLRAVRLR